MSAGDVSRCQEVPSQNSYTKLSSQNLQFESVRELTYLQEGR
jgi:hypothetical protein